MDRRWWTGAMAGVLTLVVLAGVIGSCAGTGVRAATVTPDEAAGRVPVVLVHGLTAGGPRVWGDRQADGKGLYGALVRAGYVPGRTLFCFDYGEGGGLDYVGLAGTGFDGVCRAALVAGGADRLDIVTFGSGALVARYWVTTARGTAPVRNLVMVAPPSHGQVAADFLKVLYHTDRLLRRGDPKGSGVTDPASHATQAGTAGFSDEDSFVGARAVAWRDLYGLYVVEARLGPPGTAPAAGQPPAYEAWLCATRPELVEKTVYGAQRSPERGVLGLTLAYLELVAMRVGRQLYLAQAARAGPLPPLPSLDTLLDRGLKEELVAYLLRLLRDWGGPKARELWARYKAGLGLSLGELLTGLDPTGPATSRLVPEHMVFPPSREPLWEVESDRLVLANAFLADWTAREVAARPSGSRYVTLAGSALHLPQALGLGAGPGDGLVEVVSALTGPGGPDRFLVERGLGAVHWLLPASAVVVREVLRALDGETAPGAVMTGAGEAVLWEPTWVRVEPGPTPGATAGGEVEVTVEAVAPEAQGLEGLVLRAWVASPAEEPGGVPPCLVELTPDAATADGEAGDGLPTTVLRRRVSGMSIHGGPAGTGPGVADGSEAGGSLLLGVRLVPDPAAGPAYLVMGRYLGRRARVPFAYRVTYGASVSPRGGASYPATPGREEPPAEEEEAGSGRDPDTATVEGESGPDGTGEPAWPAAEPGVGQTGTSGEPGGPGGPSQVGRAEVVPTGEPPLIAVVRVTKLTTDKKEKRTYHVRWEWDFGDGEQLSDEDPSHTTVSVDHTYVVAGTYTVSARSWANDGRLLRDLDWRVTVRDGETVTFQAETIVEPEVKLDLVGPKKWVTGKPARFTLAAEVSWPPRTVRQVVRAYPGWKFDVVWEKPGKFQVRAAVSVRQSYAFPDGQRLTLTDTYLTVVEVDVFTPGLTE